MSQQLTPIDKGVLEVQTTTTQQRVNALSQQYVSANNLESRPTEWVPGGRPIYRRLPAVSETYQVDFFNLVPPANTAVAINGIQDIGYVYVPWGEGINGPISLEVVASNSFQDILIKSGTIVWRYGSCPIVPAIINIRELELVAGRYVIAYQLIYDDAPVQHLYYVEDFSLVGQPLKITSSTNSITGWRYVAENAFLNTNTLFWSTKDTYFPSYAQPSSSYLQWESDLSSAYSSVTLRCPPKTAYTGTATLSYVDGTNITTVAQTSIDADSDGQFFKFTIKEPVLQRGWLVEWSSADISIQNITVTGTVTQLTSTSGQAPLSTLVIYPENALPDTINDSSGNKIPATYCQLALIDVDSNYKLSDIVDIRYIIHRNYQPVADWLTQPFDKNLIDLYEQVSAYSELWMAPPVCMKQEYSTLEKEQIVVQ